MGQFFSKLQAYVACLLLLCFVIWVMHLVGSNLLFNLYWIMPSFYLLIGLAWLGVHLWFASGVMRDAARLNSDAQSGGAFFVEPLAWGLAVLVGGLFVVLLYWLMHYSVLRR